MLKTKFACPCVVSMHESQACVLALCPGRNQVVGQFSIGRKVRIELWGHFNVPTMSFSPTSSAQWVCRSFALATIFDDTFCHSN